MGRLKGSTNKPRDENVIQMSNSSKKIKKTKEEKDQEKL
jgi:hypothetical protein